MAARAVPHVHRLCIALLAAMALPGMVLTAAAQDTATADDGTKETETLERISVTGSRIKRAEAEESLPITSYSKEEIEKLGITSAEQLLMTLNIAGNSSDNLASNAGIVSEEQRGNNGVSGANLRGQGADATLVLLNGRRVATHGLKGRAVDLNSIPFAAIERVEVLRDGASAIYGTDAIGGVINFITKRDYQGLQASGFVDITEEGGADIYRSTLLFGHGDLDSDGWNAFGTLSLKRNTILRGGDRDFSNAFQPQRGLSPDTRGPPFATVFSLGGAGVGASSLLRNGVLDPAGGTTRYNAVNIFNLPGAAGCEAGGPNMGPYDFRLWDLPTARFACAWDYPAAAVIQQPQDSVDFIGRATFRLGSNHEAYVELNASRVEVAKSFEPYQISSSTSTAATAFGPSSWYPLNARTQTTYNQVYNALAGYFGAGQLNYGAPIAFRWRCMECGPREIETTTDAYRLVVGVGGIFDSGFLDGWSYDTALSRASSESESVLGTGFYYTDALRTALGTGVLNPFATPGQGQSADGIAALRAASAQGVKLYGGESVVTSLDASITGELDFFSLPGGNVAMAAGIDLRREEFQFGGDERTNRRPVFQAPFDDANALNNVTRDIKAVYVEMQLPIFSQFDLNLAGRYDDYSGFGGTTNPKVSFKYRPFDWMLFRGAYSTGFKVPSFNQLYNGVSEIQYTGLDLADPQTCPGGIANASRPGCEVIRPVEIFGGKETLEPEESKQKSFGFVYSPMDQFNIALDWWEIERTNTIRSAPLDVLIQNYDLFRENWIRDASGEVVAIDRRFINSGGSLMRGVELDANLMGELAGGRWAINLNGSYIHQFRTKALESLDYSPNQADRYVRYFNLPIKWKHTLNFSYSKGAWSHNLTQIHRDGYFDEPPVSVANGTYIPSDWKPRVEGYTTYNYSLTWTGIQDLKLGFGIKNLLNQDPPFTAHQNDFAAGAGWETRIGDPRGRAYTLLVEYTFF
jgi:iron complex outermembrane recepter protein